ncbi:MAG TPA: Ig-like domain-containing protein, partial [Gemmatimonadaceae bacterium]|nr:Ig-like domain-containing protein [Gemmatimonadaceae bacterium]
MNRTLTSGVGLALAMISILSCSGDSVTGTGGLSSDDLSADATLIASVTVSLGSSSIAVGETTTATSTLRDWRGRILQNRIVTWSSSNNSVATVSTTGLVTGTGAGTAMITAARAGKSGSATITVTSSGGPSPLPVASVSVALAAGTLNPGQTTQATATTLDAANNALTGRAVTWTSSNTGVATVSSAGLVTAVAAGTSQITATSEGVSGSSAISVTTTSSSTANPGTVQDLKVAANDSATVTLSFTQTNDGAGQPAKYDIRYAVGSISWGSATSVASGSCATPVAGTAVGTQLSCKVVGLKPSTNYNFQLIAFRGTLNQDAVFGALSNIVAVTTTASSAPPPPPPPAAVASVSISPASVSIQIGAASQLTATTRDANNNVLTGRIVTWASANTTLATVSSSGLVTAKLAGTVQVTATSEGKSATATVIVAAAPPPPPPGSSNEPAGMTLIKQRAFNSLQEDPSWDTDTQMQIIQDAAAPKSPSNAMRFTFPAGFSAAGNSNGHSGVTFGGTNRVMYISYWAKYSSNWQGHSTGINKHVYAWNGNDPLFVMEAEGVGLGPLVPRPALQRLVKGDGMYEPNLVPGAIIKRGVWFHIEVVLTGNTSGSANGSMEWWLDGVKVGSVTGLQWSSGTTNWHIFEIYPVWGGVGGASVGSTMTFD